MEDASPPHRSMTRRPARLVWQRLFSFCFFFIALIFSRCWLQHGRNHRSYRAPRHGSGVYACRERPDLLTLGDLCYRGEPDQRPLRLTGAGDDVCPGNGSECMRLSFVCRVRPWDVSGIVFDRTALSGAGLGLIRPTTSAMLADQFSGPGFGKLNGSAVTIFALSGALGSFAMGYLFDRSGSYWSAFMVLAALSVDGGRGRRGTGPEIPARQDNNASQSRVAHALFRGILLFLP